MSFSNIAWDSRVLREIEAARKHYQVDVIGYGSWTPPEGVQYFQVSQKQFNVMLRVPMLLGGVAFPSLWNMRYWKTEAYRKAYKLLLQGKYDLIHANDWDSLPVATRAAGQTGARVLYDAHEYTPGQVTRQFHGGITIPYRMHFLKGYYRNVAGMITVAHGLKDLYRDNFGWDCEVIMNTPAYLASPFRPVDPDRILILHHGGAIPGRSLEDFIHLVPLLDRRYRLAFMLTNNSGYIEQLKKLAREIAPGRVDFLQPVPPAQIVPALQQGDLGIPLISAKRLSYINALPNKFFEFLMAGLGIGVTPLPEMQRLVERHGLGVVSHERTHQSLAGALNGLNAAQIDGFKRAALEFSKTINAGSEMDKLMGIYQRILSRKG